MKGNKSLKIFLATLAAISLWGYAIYTAFFSEPTTNSEKETKSVINKTKRRKNYSLAELETDVAKSLEIREQLPIYKVTSNDPFGGYELLKLTKREDEKKVVTNKAPVQTQLRLTGTICDGDGSEAGGNKAIFQHANGQGYTEGEGVSIEGELIVKIDCAKRLVIIEKEKVRFEVRTTGSRKIN